MSDAAVLDPTQTTETPDITTAVEEQKIKLVIEADILQKALSHVQNVVEKRNTIPILAHVKLEAEEDKLRLTATDMDIAIVEEVSATVEEKGALTVPAHMLFDIVRKLPSGAQLSIEGETAIGKVFIKSGPSNFTLGCLNAADFPAMEKGEFTHHFIVPAKDCMSLIDKPKFAVSTEETRYYLNGIYFHSVEGVEGKKLRSVATDGHRLARIEVDQPEGAADIPGVIIPRKTILELKKLLEQNIENVNVSMSATKIRFVCGEATLLSKLIDGTYPDYEKVIPSANNKLMEIELETLKEAVDRVSIVASDKLRAVKFNLEKGKLTLSADSQESGTAKEEVEVQYEEDLIETGFNSRYLLEMLNQIEGAVVQIYFANSTSPALVRDTGDASALYVVMPMRV